MEKKQDVTKAVAENVNIEIKDIDGFKKDELIELVKDMECVLIGLEAKLSKAKVIKKGRKEEVLEVLQKLGRATVADLAKAVGTSNGNVSSYLCYLRRDGVNIGTDSKGRKFIEVD